MNLNRLLNQYRQSCSEFWMLRNIRERTVLAVATMIMALGLTYILLINPALTGRDQLNKSLPVLRQEIAQLQALSKQAVALSETPMLTVAAISKESIEATLTSKGLKPQSVALTGDFARVQFAEVSFASMLDWLDEIQKATRLFVVDANIVALSQPDMVNVTLTLRQF